MKIQVEFNKQRFTATLESNSATRDLVTMLPMDLTIEDYAHNEKIAYLARKLTEEGIGRFANEVPGDICYYAPWGNLVFYYDGYRYSNGLVRLGRLDSGIEPLLTRGKFPLHTQLLFN